MFRIKTHLLIGIFLILGPPGVGAQQDPSSMSLSDLSSMVQQQQKMIESQNKMMEAQKSQIDDMTQALSSLSKRLDEVAQTRALAGGDTDIPPPTEQQVSLRERVAALEKSADDEAAAPANVLTAGEFKGSIRIPGTNMAGKVGGNVRLGVVNSFDPIGSGDRFIVGSIPVPGDQSSIDDSVSGITISAKRSRVNLDMRMDSSVGQFRAFIEGDFATEVDNSDVYRLRHAYGQYNRFIMGQTWSTFMDRAAEPEEIDFEGLNGEILERHPILRWTKGLGEQRLFSIAIEDPSPEIANGTGKSNIPDLVSAINVRRKWGHFQLGGVVRNVAGEQESFVEGGDPNDTQTTSDSVFGFGLSFSGSHSMNNWGKNDKFMWQLNFGEGIGAYINDMASIGGLDAVFDDDGNLRVLPALGGYLAFQHYWKRDPLSMFGAKGLLKNVRSTIVYGYTNINNFDFQPDNAYNKTQRASVNVIWSPIAPIDIGIEYLWGSRRNKDDNKGHASQFQLVATFNF